MRKLPPLRVLDFSRNLEALQRIHQPMKAKLHIPGFVETNDDASRFYEELVSAMSKPISREVISGVDGDQWGEFETVETFRHEIAPSFRGQPIPEGERSFFALREGETPRRKKKS